LYCAAIDRRPLRRTPMPTSVASLFPPLSSADRLSDGSQKGLQPLPPLPPMAKSVYYRAGKLGELRQHWLRALRDRTDATIEIDSGSHFRLRGKPLICDQDISLTVFSSGAGATLDGMRKLQIFKVQGCSLTLRGLTLVNGCPEAGLKPACRDQRTGRWRPYEGWSSSNHFYDRYRLSKPECWDVVRRPRFSNYGRHQPIFSLDPRPRCPGRRCDFCRAVGVECPGSPSSRFL